MAGTKGGWLCVSPGVGGNAACRKRSVTITCRNSDVGPRPALRCYVQLVQSDKGRPQSSDYTEATLFKGSYKCCRNKPMGPWLTTAEGRCNMRERVNEDLYYKMWPSLLIPGLSFCAPSPPHPLSPGHLRCAEPQGLHCRPPAAV